jgi:hypothetical protein
MASRQAPTEPTPRRTWGTPLRHAGSSQMPSQRPGAEAPAASEGAGVVLAAIVGTPADRRAPREGGEV